MKRYTFLSWYRLLHVIYRDGLPQRLRLPSYIAGHSLHQCGFTRHADEVGLYNVARSMKEFAASSGDAFWEPAPLIAKLAAENKPLAAA